MGNWYGNWFKSILLCMVIITVFLSLDNSTTLAATQRLYPSTQSEFYEYLKNINEPIFTRTGKQANWNTYLTYEKIVYGSPHGRNSANYKREKSLCGNAAESEYLGYDKYEKEVFNYCFPNDARGTKDPEEWDFRKVAGASSSWVDSRINDNLRSYMKYIALKGHGASTLNVYKMGGIDYARIETLPTWRSEGVIFTQNYAAGKLWYADFSLPSIAPDARIEYSFTTDKDTYTIASNQKEVTVNYTLTATATSSSPYFKTGDIAVLKAGFDPTGVQNLGASDFTPASQTKTVKKIGSFKLTRAQYRASKTTYNIPLEGQVYMKASWGEEYTSPATTSIKLIVQDQGPNPNVTTTVSVDPKSIKYSGSDVTAKVTVKGEISNLDDVNRISQWKFVAHPEEDTSPSYKYSSDKSLTSSQTFTFTIPKSRITGNMVDGQYIQSYVGRTYVTLTDGTVLNNNNDNDRTIVYMDIEPPPVEPPKEENKPPVSSPYVEPSFYWPETITPTDGSYDLDGDIVSREWTLDGSPTNVPLKFPRVAQVEYHTLGLKVTDDAGATDYAETSFKLKPTTPTAEFSIGGTLKVNRKITLDGNLSDKKSPIQFAPIDYSKTEWIIKSLDAAIPDSTVRLHADTDLSKRDFLVKDPGKYEITLIVTNVFGERSVPVSKEITVVPDDQPLAQFSVNAPMVYRDSSDGDQSKIILTDNSISKDNDIIKKRIWTVEYDSNNDGIFGSAMDQPSGIISSGNETTVIYKTNKVGNYRFKLDIQEEFGQPTLPEFIDPSIDYLKDLTDPLDYQGRVDEYKKPENYNILDKDKMVSVGNVPPVVDFGVKRQSTVDLVLDFGGLESATYNHQTGNAPGGGQYDHYYYTLNNNTVNFYSAIAATMEENLRAKGIDAKVTIDNNFLRVTDSDGTCIKNIPVYGWVDHGSYEYSSYSGTSPYSGSWEVTSSSSTPIYNTTRSTCSASYKPPAYQTSCPYPEWQYLDGGVDPKTGVIWEVYDKTVKTYDHTEYSASLRRWNSDLRYEVVNYKNQGCVNTEKVDVTDFRSDFNNNSYKSNSGKYYVRFDSNSWTWNPSDISSKMKSDDIFLWHTAPGINKSNFLTAVTNGSTKGQFNTLDAAASQKQVKDIEGYLIGKYSQVEQGDKITVVLGDKVDYTTFYSDYENDPEYQREWLFQHDPTKIDGLTIDNQPVNPIAQNGLWIDKPLQFTEVGTYKIQLRSKDNPIWFNDERFADYRKWSDESIVREYTVFVHRRPKAMFNFTLDKANNNLLSLDPGPSYDPDFETNRTDKGIKTYEWSYMLDGNQYAGKPPVNVLNNKVYSVTLTVTDLQGASDSITKDISTGPGNHKPVAEFGVQDVVLPSTKLTFVDSSFDPDGDPLTGYQIQVKKQGTSTILKTLSSFPTSFNGMGLGAGKYELSLSVADIPKIGSSLRSDDYSQTITVMDNNPPISEFTMTPNPVNEGDFLTYTDKSRDPDGNPLKNYSWKVELLDDNDAVQKTWNVGYAPTNLMEFAGIGRYRISQKVFDDPPAPLPSLSGESSIEVQMIKGPQHPYALFDVHPNDKPIYVGDSFVLDPVKSFDTDGTVVSYKWKITDPLGMVSTSTAMFPKITNAKLGTYEIQLDVFDNDGLKSKVPDVKNIAVQELPPNLLPVANFSWLPVKPFIGEDITLDPSGSFDLDGTIKSYAWEITSKEGVIKTSNAANPSFIGNSSQYTVKLTVTDDRGGTGVITKTILVNIADIKPKVVHTPEWAAKWVDNGEEADTNKFFAGEKFVIEAITTPANMVTGTVDFGGKIGKVDIPSSAFKLISTSSYQYTWKAEFWREDFEKIPKGEYLFEFTSFHPVNSPYVTAKASYFVEIVGSIYNGMKFHRNY